MKCMIADLSNITGLHRNTIYGLIHRGVIRPTEIISGVNIFSDETVESISRHYGMNMVRRVRRNGQSSTTEI
jgi:hypothetical protein